LDKLIERAAELRIGGCYWGAQPDLPTSSYTVIVTREEGARREALQLGGMTIAPGSNVDPWHVLSRAAVLLVDADNEWALLGAMAGIPIRCRGSGRFSELESGKRSALRKAFGAAAVHGMTYCDPFYGEEMDLGATIELCGHWRRLIDSNRGLTAALGFAFWKRDTVAPLLWNGSGRVPFGSWFRPFKPEDRVAVWKTRTSARVLKRLAASGAETIEAEDGFIRSTGLGADCVPPLSIILDQLGIYFDPGRPSELEQLLETKCFSAEMVERARQLRELIVQLGISKYGAGNAPLERRNAKRHLLVIGQVEDDRAVKSGFGPRTNLELLRKVREANPDVYIIYKPHPDVEAGHRAGVIADDDCRLFADEIVRNGPISSIIQLVDEVHVNTSLAGFEALLRGKMVITYGVPFYAGWGLTRDFGPVPGRRTAIRSIDELVAATLLLYPRYLDPLTGLPCPPETLVRRIAEGSSGSKSTRLVRLRRLQGKWKRSLAAFRFGQK